MQKKLYKIEAGKKICGVCGGIAEYLNMDVTAIRVIAAVFGIVGAGILCYIVAAIIMPDKSEVVK